MFNADCSIDSVEYDVLDRKFFAENIANAITSYTNNECITIGVYGGWGTGKTSLANMIIDKLPDEGYAIIKFDSWQYSNKNELIYQIFKSISKAFKMSDVSSVINGAANTIGTIGSIIKVGKYIPVISSIAEPISNVFKDYSEAIKHNNDTENSLDEIKSKIDKTLVDSKIKLVFVIDDIDRLTKDEIRLLFQAIKALGDFSNTIYILLMDKDVVESSLDGIQGGSGSEYLKKIIQIPLFIPEVSKVKLKYLIHKDVKNIVGENTYNRDVKLFDDSLRACVLKYISNLRDINRINNLFIFKFSILKEYVNFSDIYILCSLEIFNNKLYHFIENNKKVFFSVGKLKSNISDISELTEEDKTIIDFLFPHIKFEQINKDHRSNRIFEWKAFNSFYLMNGLSSTLSADMYDYVLNQASDIQIIETMKSGHYDLNSFIQLLINDINIINPKRLLPIFNAVKQIYGFLIYVAGIEKEIINDFCSMLLSKMDPPQAINALSHFFTTGDDCEQELLLTDLFISEEHNHNKWLEFESRNYKKILPDYLIDELEKECRNTNNFNNIFSFDYDDIIRMIFVWEKISINDFYNSIKKNLESRKNSLKFLVSIIYLKNYTMKDLSSKEVFIDWKSIYKYIGIDELYSIIVNEYINSIKRLDDKYKKYCVAFLMLSEKGTKNIDKLKRSKKK